MSGRPPTILLVSDTDPQYAGWLRRVCTVRHAYTGRQARDSLGDDTDGVLLDGPVLGFDVDALAVSARRHGCRAVAVTDAPPDSVPEAVETVPRSLSGAVRRDALTTLLPTPGTAVHSPTESGGRRGDGGAPITSTTAEAAAAAAVRKFLE